MRLGKEKATSQLATQLTKMPSAEKKGQVRTEEEMQQTADSVLQHHLPMAESRA